MHEMPKFRTFYAVRIKASGATYAGDFKSCARCSEVDGKPAGRWQISAPSGSEPHAISRTSDALRSQSSRELQAWR